MSETAGGREPHPVLDDYYSNAEARSDFVRALFDRTAAHYDPITALLSFGTGRWYRKRALERAGVGPGATVLDVATGTGQVAVSARALAGAQGMVTGLDLSLGMLRQAKNALGGGLVQGAIGRLPIASRRFDFVTMGYALRHAGDLDVAFGELHRVLRPGGTLLALEIGKPSSALGLRAARAYFGRFLPWCSRLTTRSADSETLMRYYWDTIDACVEPEIIVGALSGAGFEAARCEIEHGIFRSFSGRAR